MEILFSLFLNFSPMLIGSCENDLVLLYKGLKAQQEEEFSWVERFHTNYCYRSYDGDRTRSNRFLGGDFTLFHRGEWHPHIYGTEADEYDAVVLFDKKGRYHPHQYRAEIEETDTVIDPLSSP